MSSRPQGEIFKTYAFPLYKTDLHSSCVRAYKSSRCRSKGHGG